MPKGDKLTEFEIIARFLAPLAEDLPGALGLADDAAFLTPEKGHPLVLTMDTLIAGVHFRGEDRPEHIAHKALAVNVSDLAAKGADPVAYLLSLSLPGPAEADWLEGFASGLQTAQESFKCVLAGGDTVATPGPLSVTVTALGSAGEGGMVQRSGARTGDRIYVSGSIGDAVLGLMLLQGERAAERLRLDDDNADWLRSRYWLPKPRLAAVPALRANATAAMDVSDGLVGDMAKLCAASGVGARVETAKVPLSAAAREALAVKPALFEVLLTGGDDYEILATVPETQAAAFEEACATGGLPMVAIGRIADAGDGITFVGSDNRPLVFADAGFDHFAR